MDRAEWAARIAGSVGWLACEVWDEIVTGDHVLILGLVVAAEPTDEQRPPLVYARRAFGTHSAHQTLLPS